MPFDIAHLSFCILGEHMIEKILSLEKMLGERQRLRAAGARLVFLNDTTAR